MTGYELQSVNKQKYLSMSMVQPISRVTCNIIDKIKASSSSTKQWTDENSPLYNYTIFLKGISSAALEEITVPFGSLH
jgi:hypothetical protein